MDVMEPGYKMLGSTGTQYLNPDYIQPLPTTLDSKNSPLALLAQTCSSIGKDSGSSSSKLALPSLSDKKDQRDGISSTKDSSSSSFKHRTTSDSPITGASGVCGSSRSGAEATRSSKTGERSSKDCSSSRSSSSDAGGGGGGGENSPKSRIHSSRSLSLVSTGNGSGKCTPSATVTGGSLHRDYGTSRGGGGGTSASSSSSASSCPSGVPLPSAASAINNNKISSGDSSLLFDGYPDDILKSSAGFLHQQQSLQEALRLQHEGLQSLQAAAGLGPLPPTYPPLLFGHPLAAAAALDPLMYSYSASLAAAHGLALNSHKLPTLSPYLGYARVSTAAGGSTLVPVCKDPYCSTGSLPPSLHSTQHSLQPSTGGGASCGSGCTQCGSSGGGGGHDKSHRCTGPSSTTSLANGGGLGAESGQFSSPLYPLSLPPGGLVNPLLGMAAAHLGVGLAPYACSWLSGGEFCGKRFSMAEDLLQHLRTHASAGDQALPAFPLPGVQLPTPGFVGTGGGTGHTFNIPGSLSPSSLLQQAAGGQAYPRGFSPNSLLSASRYHPYKPPFAAVLPSSTGNGSLTGMGSALDAYYSSPYALFGHRIGAAAVGP